MYLVAAFILAAISGITFTMHRFLLANVPKYLILLVSSLVYITCVGAYVFMYHSTDLSKDMVMHSRHMPLLAIISFFSVFVGNVLYLHAVKHTPNIHYVTSIITAVPLIITLILARVFLGEEISVSGLVGMGLVITGIALMLMQEKHLM